MGMKSSTCGDMQNPSNASVGSPKRRHYLEDLGIYVRIILKLILMKQGFWLCSGFI